MSKMSNEVRKAATSMKAAGIYFQGDSSTVRAEVDVPVYEARDAKTKIKTRTRNFAKHLASVFADRYEFFCEARYEGVDVVTVGDRVKFKNFEIVIDYTMNQVLMYGVVVCKTMAEVEKFLGKVVVKAVDAAAFANQKVLKTKKQIEKLMTKKNQAKNRTQSNAEHSKVMVFTM